MSEVREKARALLAAAVGEGLKLSDGADATKALVSAFKALAALCDENDALERRLHLTKKVVEIREESNYAWAAENDVLLAERDALRAELAQEAALRAELAAEVKRMRVFGAAELQRRAILDAMNGGEH